MPKKLRKTYQLKIGLKGSQPPIWRRFLIENSATLRKLHEAIQIIMGWEDYHLHQYISGDRYYGAPDPAYGFSEVLDEKNYGISQLLKNEKESIIYEYDFGDSWEHKITLEKILPFDPDADLPICIKAKGACPPEDIGGIWGYYNFLEALSDENHPEHEDYDEWIEGGFDPAAYDIKEVNSVLSKYFR
ncbi:MAG: plasmid pRiA4b ORF-3 family protein [Deltaproteobacteria bacterium]|nr:plasmid pRiA4b ORF-3 family protein [Deltaproteobacteria bacterium]